MTKITMSVLVMVCLSAPAVTVASPAAKAPAAIASLQTACAPIDAQAGQPAPPRTAEQPLHLPVRISGRWEQGALLHGQAPAGARVNLGGRDLRVDAQGHFIFGLDRDAPAQVKLSVQAAAGAVVACQHAVAPRHWDVQKIQGLPPDKVNPPSDVDARIAAEQKRIKAAFARDTEAEGFLQAFQWPVRGRVSGVFGSQRVLNGVPKQPHYGMDVAVASGTPVAAPAAGVVSLAEPDLYFTGGTLIIDHGHGLSSIMVHLSRIDVKVGEVVRQGQAVAQSGQTGRATGPHLHWGVYWFDAHLDPQRLLPP